MTQTHRRLAAATAASAALVLSAPYVGVVRSQIRAAFPGQFGLIINGVVATALLAALVWALARVRSRRLPRYGAIALAFAAAAAYSYATDSTDPAVRAVEHFHFVEFSVLSTPIRLKIISAVCNGEKNVSELLAEIDTTQPNMSQHLSMLYRSGVLARVYGFGPVGRL